MHPPPCDTMFLMDPKAYIKLLRSAGAALQIIRDEELRAAEDSNSAILALSDSFLFAIAAQPPPTTSGLVEFQKHIRELKS